MFGQDGFPRSLPLKLGRGGIEHAVTVHPQDQPVHLFFRKLQESAEGVMLTKTASHVAKLDEDKGKPLVYIDYLEAAPWNWRIPELGREGLFRGIGSLLFWKAVKQSKEEAFHGRVGLHALPQAESFYERAFCMVSLGRDPQKQNLLYFELSRQQAESLLDDGGPS